MPFDDLLKGLCFMYLNINNISLVMGKFKIILNIYSFLLELVRSAHVGNLPVVVVSEVVAGAGALVHQVVRPLPRAEVPRVVVGII